MKKIIIINGMGGSGKDTFVEYVGGYIKTLNISSVDIVKEAAKVLGWKGEKTEKARLFLSSLKAISTLYNNHSYNYVVSKIKEFNSSEYDIMFIHIREPDEIKKFVSEFQLKTLLIEKDNIEKITSNNSDKNVNEYNYDYKIKNNGTKEDLNKMAYGFIKTLGF